MKNINVSEGIIPIGQFKSGISKYLKSVQATGQPLVITQNGRPAGVLLSPVEYDALVRHTTGHPAGKTGAADAAEVKTYAGSWQNMPEKIYQDFINDIAVRRSKGFSERRKK